MNILESKITPVFIAEIKTKSPFGYQSPHSFHKLMDVAIEHGDWIIVHDNALWGGDYETISFVRKYTKKPILAKGLHTTEESIQRAFDHGADKVLVVGDTFKGNFAPDSILREIENKNPKNLWSGGMCWKQIVINSRNLRTGDVVRDVEKQISDFKNQGYEVFQASNIKSINDVNRNVTGYIVGTHLIDFINNR